MKLTTLKLLLLILTTLLLINPVVIFIITDRGFVSIFLSFISIILICVVYEINVLKFLTPYFISIFSAFSILIHAEAVFISNFKDYVIEDLYILCDKYYFNRPLLKKTFSDKEYVVSYATSKQGFRIGKEDNPDVEISECDWLVLGDSYTQGAQVEYEDLYTSKLYKLFPDKVIINSGISGWGLPEAFNYYITKGHKLKPKKVLLQICNFNDFMNVTEKESSFTDLLMNHSQFLRFLLYPFKYSNPAELPLGRWTEPFYPTQQANQDYNVFFKHKSVIQKKDLENFSSFLLRLNESVRANGAELIILQIPSKEQLYYKYFEEVVNNFKIEVKDLDMNYPNQFLSGICRNNNIKYLDLLMPLGGNNNEIFFQFDEHLNVNGHMRLAEELATFIKAEVDTAYSGNVQVLSQNNSEDRYPIFHDDNLICFQSVRDSNIELFTADSLLGNSKRITFDNVDELHPWIDKANNRVMFTEGDQADGNTKIVSMYLNGTDRKYFTEEGYFGAIPALNSTHTKVAYPEWTISEAGQLTNPRIVLVSLKDKMKIEITHDEYESWRPIFSPTDSALFYISKRNGKGFDIYRYNLETKTETNLTNTAYDEWDPFISPDGKKIVYAGFKNENWDIFLLDIESGKIHQVTNTVGNEWDTSFSPDGKYIYYAGVYGSMNGIYRLRVKYPLGSK